MTHDDSPCPDGQHKWTGRQIGGPPDAAESYEWVEYCEVCGIENPGSGEFPVVTSNTAAPGMAWRDIARSAYRAYAASTGNKNFRGDPMPEFDTLPTAIQTAWQAAVRQAVDCIDGQPGDEARWANWAPPIA